MKADLDISYFSCQQCAWCCKNFRIDITYEDVFRWVHQERKDILDEQLLKDTVQSHRATHTHTVEIDDTYPSYFLENLEFFRSLGWIWEEENQE